MRQNGTTTASFTPRLYEFERYMRYKGVDVDLTGNPDPAEKPVDIVLQSGKQIVRSYVFWGIEHNIDVMHRLGTERQFGNILEAARSEKTGRMSAPT